MEPGSDALPGPPIDDMPDASAFDDVSDSDLMQVEFDDDDAPMPGAPAESGLGEPEPAAPATQTATEPIHAQAAHDDLEDSLLDTLESPGIHDEPTAAYPTADEDEPGQEWADRDTGDVTPVPGESAPAPVAAEPGSAAAHLFDESLSTMERIAWVVDEVPRRTDADLASSGIGSQAAFVLQMVDGATSFEDIIDIVGLPAVETQRLLLELLQKRVITTPSLDG